MQKQPKLVRITDEAHKVAKIQAAVEGSNLEEWISKVILAAAKVKA